LSAGVNSQNIALTQFPIDKPGLELIQSYATAQHLPPFPDAKALTVELKASWVDASMLPAGAVSGYITTKATVPTYDHFSNRLWTWGPTKQTTLALVGLHIAASVAGHAEMIFATFEHIGNTPEADYTYAETQPGGGYTSKTVTSNTSGTWLFWTSGSNINQPRMVQGPFVQSAQGTFVVPQAYIFAYHGSTIGPSNILRMKPWGSPSDWPPNPNVFSAAVSNSHDIPDF